jgi:hypothetical protein
MPPLNEGDILYMPLPAEPLMSSFDGSGVPHSRTPASGPRRRVLTGSIAFLLTGILIASAYFLWSSGLASSILKSADPKMPVAEATQDGVTVSILSADGQIHAKDNALQIKFQDPGRSKTLAALITGEYPHFRERL